MGKILEAKFFERPAPEVAKNLLGKFLIKILKDGKKEKFLITETEAYEGLEDRASHASKGKTKRNAIMFGKPGIFYVYLVYGMYYMLNIVTGKKDHPAAVLIRGIERIEKSKDSPTSLKLREVKKMQRLNGPGCLTRSLKIDKKLNGLPATVQNGLWFEYSGLKISKLEILKTPRIGVSYAGLIWSQKPWRFIYKKVV